MKTLAQAKLEIQPKEELLKAVQADDFGELCRLAIWEVMKGNPRWLNREFTEREILGVMRAIREEMGTGFYEFKSPGKAACNWSAWIPADPQTQKTPCKSS